MDFLSDVNGDIAIVNGDFVIVTGVDETIQFLCQSLRLWLAEWFLDESLGMPYFDSVFIKNPDPIEIDSIFKTKIIESPGVLELLSFSMDIDSETRSLTITGSIRGLDGEADFTVSVDVPTAGS